MLNNRFGNLFQRYLTRRFGYFKSVGVSYLLLDLFGSTPSIGNRTIVDSTSKFNIAANALNCLTGASSAYSDPRCYYNSYSRIAGRALIYDVNLTDSSGDLFAGWFQSNSGGLGNATHVIYFGGAGNQIRYYDMTGPQDALVGTFVTGVTYTLALILKSSGVKNYIKGGSYTTWTLLNEVSTNSNASLIPLITKNSARGRYTRIAIPDMNLANAPAGLDRFA